MQPAQIPQNEFDREEALRSLHVLDTEEEERFNRITREAAAQLHVPICAISLVDTNREWLKSCVGTDARSRGRDISFCGHTIMRGMMFVIEDTQKDPRFADNPQVTNPPYVRFYAGVTLHEKKTHLPIGALCIKDTKPRSLSTDDVGLLLHFALEAEKELNALPAK